MDLRVCAEQDMPFCGSIVIEVLREDDRYVIMEAEETLISSPDPELVTLYVNEMTNFYLAHHMKGLVKIHAACGSLKGRRFLLAGEKGAGKTTLVTKLLFEGMNAHGDERVLVRGDQTIPLPRKFHLKEGSVPLIPQLSGIWNRLTPYPGYGVRTCYFAPPDAGFAWETRWGHADVVFYLLPNHKNETWIETSPTWGMAQNLILRASDFDVDPESQVGELCEITSSSENFVIHIGELNAAVRLLCEILG